MWCRVRESLPCPTTKNHAPEVACLHATYQASALHAISLRLPLCMLRDTPLITNKSQRAQKCRINVILPRQ